MIQALVTLSGILLLARLAVLDWRQRKPEGPNKCCTHDCNQGRNCPKRKGNNGK
jgi:hypothetical protein